MRKLIPQPVIAVVAEVLAGKTHTELNKLFLYAGAPGEPPSGNKEAKAMEWLRRVNNDTSVTPLEVLGKLIEETMDKVIDTTDYYSEDLKKRQDKLANVIRNSKLSYHYGGIVTAGAIGTASRSLDEHVRKRNFVWLDDEFQRALTSADTSPREGVSAACNILEAVCKVYIEDEGLDMPSKKDIQPIWNVVRKNLGFDPSCVEDQDLQRILTGLISIVDGVGALRTHASTAHAAGRQKYNVEPRHARLAIHAAHTLVLFILESWEKRQQTISCGSF